MIMTSPTTLRTLPRLRAGAFFVETLLLANENEIETAKQLGALTQAVANTTDAVHRHADAVAQEMVLAKEARAELHRRIDESQKDLRDIEHKVDIVCRKLDEYEPDLRRCRMFRYWGIISVSLITVGAVVVGIVTGLSEWFSVKFTGGRS